MNKNDIANLADVVAKAMYDTTSPDGEVWGDLTEAERDDFRMAAHAAMKAHIDWLTLNGWTMLKMEKRPKKGLLDLQKPKLIGLN